MSRLADHDGDWPVRSLLFTPAHRTNWVEKAADAGPGAVILDLEDSVPEAERPAARRTMRDSMARLRARGVVPVARINALDQGGDEDVAAIASPDLAAVILPKAGSVAEVLALSERLAYAEGASGTPLGRIRILCLPETAAGLRDAGALAAASARVCGLMTGVAGPVSGDIARATGFRPSLEGSEQLYIQSRLILESRAAGAEYPVAGIFGTALDDLAAIELLAERARRLGFTGAAVMHPTHVAIVNRVFRPSEDEIAYNRGLIEALDAARAEGKGAVRYRGMMIDYAMLEPAQRILAEAERTARREAGTGAGAA